MNITHIPTGSPICPVCHTPTDGLASLPTSEGTRIHRTCIDEFLTARGWTRHQHYSDNGLEPTIASWTASNGDHYWVAAEALRAVIA